jgi:predicted DNA-binding protein
VQLPLDGALFEQRLKTLIASSGQRKPKVVREAVDDMANSFR